MKIHLLQNIARALVNASGRFGQAIGARRQTRVGRFVMRCMEAFRYRAENVNFDAEANGECRVLRIVAQRSGNGACVFDVGANIGQWALLANSFFDDARIHSFEIVPKTFERLLAQVASLSNVVCNCFGLGEKRGDVEIWVKFDYASDSTAFPVQGVSQHIAQYQEVVHGKMIAGLEYLEMHNIPEIDFLKIDTEGMDFRVIQGFGEQISRAKVIQFEYGVFNIQSRDLLQDFYLYLNRHGFLVGKIYPNGVDFFDYQFLREDFLGNNYIAVRRDQIHLIAELAGPFGTAGR